MNDQAPGQAEPGSLPAPGTPHTVVSTFTPPPASPLPASDSEQSRGPHTDLLGDLLVPGAAGREAKV